MKNNWASIGAFSLALAISLGAWNAHGMEKFVENGQILEKYLKTFHTGVEYQFINSIGILILGLFGMREIPKLKNAILIIFTGMCLFSFSLYLLSFHQLLGAGFKILGAITPIGGLFMIIGWIYTGILFLKTNKQ